MLKLQIPADSRFVTTVRAVATTLLENLGVDPDAVYDANLVLGEICSNVVRHAYADPAEAYEVDLRFLSGALAITVTDRGRGIDPAARRPPDPHRPNGWGLWLVEHLCGRVTVEPVAPHGTRVTAHLPLRTASHPSRLPERASAGAERPSEQDVAHAAAG